jgi:hypothetical protein
MHSMAKIVLAPEDDYGDPSIQDSGSQGRENDSEFTHDFRRLSFHFGLQHMEIGTISPWPRTGSRGETKPDGKQRLDKKQREERP